MTEDGASTPSLNVPKDVDEETLRIMVSTDNHLGYAERDPIRGNDSFAAFEEVLINAKKYNCDMVLLAGDLFHENKPTRRTLHKTLGILRHYAMGPNPVSFQIVSDQRENFRSAGNIHKTVNYEDPYSSIDLPIFSIHGNHDDPTRDGGTEMLASLDLLATTNVLNYFGRQDEVDKVQISPVLIKKGSTTKVALYGMGNMRDERLNRMWQGKKVRFLRPEPEDNNDDDDDDDEDHASVYDKSGWFNIFALHQNRDLGRGTKNCVHESMIPEWMDLVVWGHEHECLIQPTESAVGTFRITQPGSSVATSLTEGEASPKHVGILDIRGPQFRLSCVPLKQVRSFAVGSIVLKDAVHGLDSEDPHIDEAMGALLEGEVARLVEDAREKLLVEDGGNSSDDDDDDDADDEHNNERNGVPKRKPFKVEKPQQVLVRLKVEHSGFSTLNNQRFGSRFVKEVANPSDILCFHRKRVTEDSKRSKTKSNKSNVNSLANPSYPDELNTINMENIIKDTLETTDKKLQILDEEKLGVAVEDFVSKEQKQVFSETVDTIVTVQQRRLVKRGLNNTNNRQGADATSDVEFDENKVTTANAVREVCMEEEQPEKNNKKRSRNSTSQRRQPRSNKALEEIDDSEDDEVYERRKQSRKVTKLESTKRKGKRIIHSPKDSDFDDEEEEVSVVREKQSQSSSRGRNTRKLARSQKYTHDEDDEDEIDEIIENVDSSSDVEVLEKSSFKSKIGSYSPANGSKRKRNAVSSSQTTTSSSFASSRRKRTSARGRKVVSYFGGTDDDDDDDDDKDSVGPKGSAMGAGWGTASQSSTKRARRR